ncbi:transcription factor atoh8 [Aplochiton taeniatus]
MRNPHLISDGWKAVNGKDATGKSFKRKSREPKRVTDFSIKYDSRTDDGLKGEPMEETGKINYVQKRLQEHSAVVPVENPTVSSVSAITAIDMRINAVHTITTTLSSSKASLPVKTHRDNIYITALSPVRRYEKHQPFGQEPTVKTQLGTSHAPEPSLHSQLVCQQRGESFLLAASPAPYSHNSNTAEQLEESPRKRPGESPGGVPEIKAIQQTRRLLANARERTRVHTISAAFEALRKQVPCYSYGQKLSKLAILRIACNYILSLAQLAQLDYSPNNSTLSFVQCVEQCTRTLQAEGRSKKRKD